MTGLSKMAVAIAGGALLATALVLPGNRSIQAADHGDSPSVAPTSASDLNDLFAWMSSDASKVYLAMTVEKDAADGATFSDAVQFVFHTKSTDGTQTSSTDIVCTFDSAGAVSCWVGEPGGTATDYVTGDASAEAGITSSSGQLKVFAGLRDDPFYFNAAGFFDATSAVAGVAGGLTFDANGCPELDAGTAGQVAGKLALDGSMGPGQNAFAGQNVLALVVAVDKALLTTSGDILTVFAGTHAEK